MCKSCGVDLKLVSVTWFPPVVPISGSHQWFPSVVPTSGSHQWFPSVVPTSGSHPEVLDLRRSQDESTDSQILHKVPLKYFHYLSVTVSAR